MATPKIPGAKYREQIVQPIRHGLYVKSRNGLHLRDERTGRVVHRMRNVMPWLEESDVPACRGWAQLEILADIAYGMLKRDGIMNAQGEPKRLLDDYRKLRMAQLSFERELGMTQVSRSMLRCGRVAFDLAHAMAAQPMDDAEIVTPPALTNGTGK